MSSVQPPKVDTKTLEAQQAANYQNQLDLMKLQNDANAQNQTLTAVSNLKKSAQDAIAGVIANMK